MDVLSQNLSKDPEWYRRIMLVFWAAVGLNLAINSLKLLTVDKDQAQYLATYILQQGGSLVGLMLVAEALSRINILRSDYTLLGICHGLMGIIVYFHQDITFIPLLLFSPMLLGALSFKRSRIITALAGIIGSFLILYLTLPQLVIWSSFGNIITVLCCLVATTLMALLAALRGKQILDNLHNASNANQELLVKSIIMDKLFKLDALTELYNHKTFHEYLEKLIEQHESNGLPIHLAILDLDNFKKVNDTYGHWAGDHILMRTAGVLRQHVTPNDFVARYGGEEFAIIFTEKTLGDCYKVLERIRLELEGMRHEELGFRPVTCSIGLEAYKKGTGKDFLFRSADASLYAAKKRGKNQISSTDMPALREGGMA